MKRNMQNIGFGVAAIGFLLVANTQAADNRGWSTILNETRGPIRAANTAPVSGAAVGEILGGPTNGSNNAYLIHARMPPGAHGPALFTLPAEDDYVVLSGQLTVQIGSDTFVAGPMTGIIIPAGTPHEVWNAGTTPETHLQVIASADPDKDLSRDLNTMMKPAKAAKVADAAKYIRKIKVPSAAELQPGLNRQVFTNRSMGSPITIGLDSVQPGSGGPKPHVHPFEQVYFEVEGETNVMYGLMNAPLKKLNVVIIPPGVVHTNNNQSNAIERHITLLLPEPAAQPFDVEFEKKGPAQAAGTTPGKAP